MLSFSLKPPLGEVSDFLTLITNQLSSALDGLSVWVPHAVLRCTIKTLKHVPVVCQWTLMENRRF